MENWLRNPRVQGTGDAVLAAFLALTSVLPVLGGDPSWGKPKALGVALGLLSTVPVAWRARRPLTALRSCSSRTARASTPRLRTRRRSSRSSR